MKYLSIILVLLLCACEEYPSGEYEPVCDSIVTTISHVDETFMCGDIKACGCATKIAKCVYEVKMVPLAEVAAHELVLHVAMGDFDHGHINIPCEWEND